jgi:LSD1 subclass zinc finger protein
MAHDPNEVAVIMDVTGKCRKCLRHTIARLVAYYSGEVLIRCSNCKTANQFDPDDATYTDAKKFAPFMNDEDDDQK